MFEPMRYAALFGILGTLLAGAAVQSAAGGAVGAAWVLAAAEAYVALCLFAMALAYGLNHWGLPIEWAFQHPGWMQAVDLLLLPYRLLARVTFGVLRRLDPMDLMHPVGTRLFVGRLPLPADHGRLAEHGVTSVLNLCAEFPRLSRLDRAAGLTTAYLPILDGAAPTERQFRAAVDWIAARHGEGRSVLVHCAQGRGRSVTVAAAALCRLGLATDPADALARITAARPRACPSRKQRLALDRFLTASRADLLPS
jgi:predicted protein tyrosine phosphatase